MTLRAIHEITDALAATDRQATETIVTEVVAIRKKIEGAISDALAEFHRDMEALAAAIEERSRAMIGDETPHSASTREG